MRIIIKLCALRTIFTILLTFLGKSYNAHMLHASGGVYYSYMVTGPNFEFRKVIRKFYLFLELIQSAKWVQNGKNEGFTKMSVELRKSYIDFTKFLLIQRN